MKKDILIPITVTVTERVDTTITKRELAWAIMSVVINRLGEIDDAGLDWMVEWNDPDMFGLYIGGEEWRVSKDEELMVLVDAANVLHYGHTLNLED
jgi:hypothetical protein